MATKWPKPAEGSWTEHYPDLGTGPIPFRDFAYGTAWRFCSACRMVSSVPSPAKIRDDSDICGMTGVMSERR